MRVRTLCGVWLCLLAATAVAADVVVMKNGDRITGEIVDIKGGTLTMTTTYLPKNDTISVDFAQVGSIESSTPRRVVLTSGDAGMATFVSKPGGVFIESAELGGTRPLTVESLETVGIPAVQWSGALGANVNGSEGNTKTLGFAVFGAAARETKQDLIRLSVRSGYAQNQVTSNGKKSQETTQQFTVGRGSYDYNFTERFFGDIFVDLENDRFKDLNLRSRLGAGPGYRFINTDSMLLRGVAGLAWVHEIYRQSGVSANDQQGDKDFVTAFGSEEFRWTIAEGQKLYQTLDIYPDLQSASNFVLHIEAGYRQNIWGDFFADLAVIDDYDNDPAEGRKSNDFKYLLGVGYSF